MTKKTVQQIYSIVVPVYNSCSTLEPLVIRVTKVLKNAEIPFELLLVDDGSSDDSFLEIKRLSSIFFGVRGYRLSRNFGHQAALSVGLQQANGNYVAIIDDDLQDPPELLSVLYKKLQDGYDVAYGVRQKRKEGLVKRVLFRSFYKILTLVSRVDIPQDSGDFCAMRRCVVDAMLEMYDATPFLRGFRYWVGFRQIGVEYERSARFQGESGYTLRKYIKLAMTGILMFSNLPLRLSTYLGLAASFIACSFTIVAFIIWSIRPFNVPGYLSTIVLIAFMGGVQLVSSGILGEYMIRLLDNSRRWPIAIVAEKTEEDSGS